MAANDLTTLAFVQNYLADTSAASTAQLPPLITAASTFFQGYVSQPILTATFDEFYDGNGNNRLILANQPVISVASVTVCGSPVSAAVGQGNGYIVDKYGITYRGWRFPRTVKNIEVVYAAGYAATAAQVPFDIQQCIAEMVAIKYKRVINLDKTSVSIGDQTTSFVQSDLTKSVIAVMELYQMPFIA